MTTEVIEYEELKPMLDEGKYILIDVRDREEVKSGKIPKSVNIPLPEIVETFRNLSDSEFKEKFGFEKSAQNLVFSCRSGRRAEAACEAITSGSAGVQCGETVYRLYKGSFLDWESKGGPIER